MLRCISFVSQVGVIGTGMIGRKFAQKVSGLVSKVLCYDAYPNK